jgi:nitrogen fixation protein FixH
VRAGTRLALGAAVAAGLGAVITTVWVGARVKEETVVAKPYEEGLRYDEERRARAELGWQVRLATPAPRPAPLAFEILDAAGRPLDGATVTVSIERPDTSRDARRLEARALGGGRHEAGPVALEPGPWRLRFDVRRGDRRVQLERTVRVDAPCDPGAGPCTVPLGGGLEVRLDLGPRPLRTMRELTVTAELLRDGAPAEEAGPVTVRFEMRGMEMGENRVVLRPAGRGRWAGQAVLVRCPSGRADWTAAVSAAGGTAAVDFRVAE